MAHLNPVRTSLPTGAGGEALEALEALAALEALEPPSPPDEGRRPCDSAEKITSERFTRQRTT